MRYDRYSKIVVLIIIFCILFMIFPLTGSINAQSDTEEDDTSGRFGGIVCCLMITLLPVLYFIGYIFIVVWVYFDAKGRGMENLALWVVLAWFLDIIGLIIYLIMRPKGKKEECPHCKKKSLESIEICPFCKKGKNIDVIWD